jgi:hypothetical protein
VALVGVFVVAFFFGWQSDKTPITSYPASSENAAASCALIVNVNDCAGEIEIADRQGATSIAG